MFDEKNNNQSLEGSNYDLNTSIFKKYKPYIIIGSSFFFLIIILVIAWFVLRNDSSSTVVIEEPKEEEIKDEDDFFFTGLNEHLGLDRELTDDMKVDPAKDGAVEYLTFAQFYEAPERNNDFNFLDYNLPMNIKTDVVNYYEVNRRINLDSHLNTLNNNGFVIINNPWPEEATDFYSAYKTIDRRNLPLFISSDFLLYHYNLILKDVFKNIESSFFFDSLWEINLDLYNQAKIRYEYYLSKVGHVNDPILEGKRLAVAYFAVALKLLSPTSSQIEDPDRKDASKFSINESYRFRFDLPGYLNIDVLPELNLIRNSSGEARSPVLLYTRNYGQFSVPRAYRSNARQNNFYLATMWLNSLFPLHYRNSDCPDCLLDEKDWRINFTAANLIAQDISSSEYLKSEWARLYKIMSFTSGLEDILSYIHYRDDYNYLFADSLVSEVFSLDNDEAVDNLNQLRLKLSDNQFKEMQGGRDYNLPNNLRLAGFRILAQPHWPFDYVFRQLSYPNVSSYLNPEPRGDNVTACEISRRRWHRCNGFSGDLLALLDLPLENSSYYQENMNYQNYSESLSLFKSEHGKGALDSRYSSQWALLSALEPHLSLAKESLPVFAQNSAWQNRLYRSAAAALVDWELEADRYRIERAVRTQGTLSAEAFRNIQLYIEPSVTLLEDLLANLEMISRMLSALGADEKAYLAMSNLDFLYDDLVKIKQLSIDSIEKQNLSHEEKNMILNWLKSYSISSLGDKRTQLRTLNNSTLSQNLRDLRFLVVIFPTDEGPMLAFSPIFHLREGN